MNFDIFGPYEVRRTATGFIEEDQTELWDQAMAARQHLDQAVGCYLFGIRNEQEYVPWYASQTGSRPFRSECFTLSNRNTLDQIYYKSGSRVLILIPTPNPETIWHTPSVRAAHRSPLDRVDGTGRVQQ
jgi:hypothetical protein